MDNLPKALSPREAAQVLGISDDTWYRHVRPEVQRGEILSYRIGRNVRIITASLLAWQERRATSEAA